MHALSACHVGGSRAGDELLCDSARVMDALCVHCGRQTAHPNMRRLHNLHSGNHSQPCALHSTVSTVL